MQNEYGWWMWTLERTETNAAVHGELGWSSFWEREVKAKVAFVASVGGGWAGCESGESVFDGGLGGCCFNTDTRITDIRVTNIRRIRTRIFMPKHGSMHLQRNGPVSGRRSIDPRTGVTIRFHVFHKDQERRRKWFINSRRNDLSHLTLDNIGSKRVYLYPNCY
ncbi:hypothetical protein CAPTEDRAFT_188237 [Capitella teleta]|uniref:Uncharacterized protein n=1 Tax=Capitella teleta TaxID=283909 RepID=R7T7M5_CAPTE|nr:hypothetical protein CAPTEDRAFT_188237 [Capitella teleta]|eukprot:ELT87420.1 hypothetical protein CAPTEDRAFT_188237 [Capitella teleta]